MTAIGKLLDDAIADPRHGWSIGTFGAIGEFARDDDEPAYLAREGDARRIVTTRGGMRIAPVPGLQAIAYDTLASDGETWGQSVAFCLPVPSRLEQAGVQDLGADGEALKAEDRDARLFDLGVGRGHVRFCVRTRDDGLIAALQALAGRDPFGPDGAEAMREVLRAQPNRIMLSPVGRVEVYSPIPLRGGASPEGPHTHLLPRMLASGRTHAANAPIPDGMQPVLYLHPRSPWRDGLGQRVPFDAELDAHFNALLAQFGLPQDLAVREQVEQAVASGVDPAGFAWPETRRGRAEARIALRRIARSDGQRVAPWRQRYDRLPESEAAEDDALHA